MGKDDRVRAWDAWNAAVGVDIDATVPVSPVGNLAAIEHILGIRIAKKKGSRLLLTVA